MDPINVVEIETPRGYRSFELYRSDITKLDFPVDLMVISAFAGSYTPTRGTIIEALGMNCGLDVKRLATNPWLDFRPTLGCWVSHELPGPAIKRLLGAELVGGTLDISEVLGNVFVAASVAEMKGVVARTIALPVLGAGSQNLDSEEVIAMVLPKAMEYLQRSVCTSKIVFVENNPQHADLLNHAMNETLGRDKVTLPKGMLINNIRKEIAVAVERARMTPLGVGVTLNDVRRVLDSETSRTFEIGLVARRLAERIADEIVQTTGEIDLYAKIERTATCGIAPWIRSYLHVLRVFGNEAAHERDRGARTPVSINEADLALCFFCLLRVLSFYLEWDSVRKGDEAPR